MSKRSPARIPYIPRFGTIAQFQLNTFFFFFFFFFDYTTKFNSCAPASVNLTRPTKPTLTAPATAPATVPATALATALPVSLTNQSYHLQPCPIYQFASPTRRGRPVNRTMFCMRGCSIHDLLRISTEHLGSLGTQESDSPRENKFRQNEITPQLWQPCSRPAQLAHGWPGLSG